MDAYERLVHGSDGDDYEGLPIAAWVLIALCLMPFIAATVQSAPIAARMSEGQAQASWDGMWVGNWSQGNGTQIVFAGDDVIAFYWRGDYVSGVRSSMAHSGTTVMLTWPSGTAALTRETVASAHIVIHEKGKPEAAFALKRDS